MTKSSIGIIIGILLICFIWFLLVRKQFILKQSQKELALIEMSYGVNDLIADLWWSSVEFPIIWFWGIYWEPAHILSIEEYKRDYMFWYRGNNNWFWAEYFFDKKWNKYITSTVSINDIKPSSSQEIQWLRFEKVTIIWSGVSFGIIRDTVISEIKKANNDNINKSVYSNVYTEIEKSSNIDELAQNMSKWQY